MYQCWGTIGSIQVLKLFWNIPLYNKCLPPKPSHIFPLTNPRVNKLKCSLHIVFPIYLLIFDPPPPNPPPIFLHHKPQENAPCPHLDKHFTFSLNIMTLPRIFNFGMLKPENDEKTDHADQIVQTYHLTGHATGQTFFTFSVECFSHLPDLPLFTFSVEICFTFTGPVIFHI